MTELKIVSAIKNYVTSHRGVTGSPLRNEQIADEVDTLRMRMIAEMDKANFFRKPYQGFVQKFSITTIPSNKIVTIPKLYIKDDGTPAIDYVGGIGLTTPYRIITGINHKNWITKDEFLGTFPTVMIEGNQMEIINIAPNAAVLYAVFEDPGELEDFGQYNPDTSDYPIPNSMVDQIIGKTAESYIRTMYRVPPQPNTQVDLPQTPQK